VSGQTSGTRAEVSFASGDATCAGWLYEPPDAGGGTPRTCVVMAHGFSLTRHDGLPAYAERLAAAGACVLVFDHRHLGDSGGEPRQRFRVAEQLADWRSAIAYARALDGVDPGRIVAWGYSFSGGHVATLAARDGGLAAAMVLSPFVNGLRRVLSTKPATVGWILPRAVRDVAGGPNLIPVTGQPGARAAMTLPGEADGFARSVPAGSPWRNEISPGVFATIAFYRPLARAGSIRCPLWVGLGERDVSVHGGSVARLAARAPHGELHRYPYDHFDGFVGDAPARVAADQVDFLRRNSLVART
jgi:dienelactone hydrolase